jgi:acetoin utilization deacetylase AcuC-like enzyme
MAGTGYFTHSDCRKHEMGQGHPECPQRLDAIEDRLLVSGLDMALTRLDPPLAAPHDLELAHDRMHIAALRGLADQLVDDIKSGGPEHAQIDPDTSMNQHTWQAALRSAGAALAATEAVLNGELDNAFCAVRPPGHHACYSRAMGFCFFNNVALAARFAVERHGLERVAVVDFDVHHGNGTEDILSGDDRFLMTGIFQHPFYPYSGSEHPATNMHNVPVPAYTKGMEIREVFAAQVIPKLESFRPQLILISAGFDAHREDDMGQLSMTESDYAWITDRVMEVADNHAQGKVVSCLEGGYDLSALARSVEAHVRAMARV